MPLKPWYNFGVNRPMWVLASSVWCHALAGLVLLAWCAGDAVQAQSDINLSGYTLVFSDEFTNANWTSSNPKGSYTWRSLPPRAGDVFGYSVRDQNSLSISNG